MFTPPPSPLPVPRIIVTDDPDSESKAMKDGSSDPSLSVPSSYIPSNCDEKRMQDAQDAATEAIIRNYERKKRTARRTRCVVLLVPVILIIVALTSRRLAVHEAFEDLEMALGSRGENPLSADEPSVDLNLEMEWRGQESAQSHDRLRHHKRQTLSLSNPAAPSGSVLFSSIASDSGATSATGTPSPTTTVPQTEQTIPPVPDSSNTPALPTPFPQPFDTTGAVNNLTTQACANFFTNMTQQLAFRSCRPFSLLEYFSDEFIESQTNLTLLNTLIYGTCTTTTDFDTCISNMDWFASSLSTECDTELKQNNLMVQETLLGLQSYSLLRTAACLVNQQSNTYCYAAAAHSASPADLYYYQLPLGIGFPVATTQPSCSTCAKSLLGLYADALKSGNSSAAGLKQTYEAAANQAEDACGGGFAVIGLATTGVSTASGTLKLNVLEIVVTAVIGTFVLAMA